MKALLLLTLVLFVGCNSDHRNNQMSEDTNAIQCLRRLISKDNFAEVPGTLYTGVQNPSERIKLNAQFSSAVELLIAAANHGATTSEYLAIIDKQINGFERAHLDTEDAEQVASNFELALNCLGIESSGGILNKWMYGFEVP